MVLYQPPNKHVMEAFSLKGKVAVITGDEFSLACSMKCL
jgi:hypothetical protein